MCVIKPNTLPDSVATVNVWDMRTIHRAVLRASHLCAEYVLQVKRLKLYTANKVVRFLLGVVLRSAFGPCESCETLFFREIAAWLTKLPTVDCVK